MATKTKTRGTATVNFPYVQRKAVVIDRQIETAAPYREVGKAFHNGGQWHVYRNFKSGQWNATHRV